ncbi:MAG: hypothetical protein ACRD51_05575 [Candidatus Acidiferrum sp.]
MSTEHHNSDQTSGQPPRHSDVRFEPRDINARTVGFFLFFLALAVIATFLVSVFVFRFTTEMAFKSDTPLPPMRQGIAPTMPPEPRLQGVPGHRTDPQEDLREKMAADEAANEKLDWVDKQAGIAQIPVEDAMKIIVEKGMPAVPVPPGKKR